MNSIMKTKYILKATLLTGVMIAASSCREETINFLDASAIPQASDYNIKVEVNQETNQYTLSLTDASGAEAKGVYPVWKIYTKNNPVMSTRPVYSDIVAAAGDYDVEVQVGNHNGVSDGVKTSSIHIENTIMDFTPYIKFLTDNEEKTWHINAEQQGHLGCGESGTDGLNWWSAAPYDKADWGVYDNQMTFTDNGIGNGGLYTYDPGKSGTIYVNTGITDLSPYSEYNTNDGIDYCAPAPLQENVPFTFTVEGTDLFIVFPQGTLMGYLPNIELYNEPKFKVNELTKNTLAMTCDNGGIAWHYILAPLEEAAPQFTGFVFDSPYNLWKDASIALASTWFADGGWGELSPQPEVEVSAQRIALHTPEVMGNDQWQGQVHINTGIKIEADKTYDFSMWLNAPVDCAITVKPHPEGDDNTFFVADKQNFSAFGSCYYFSDLPGFDTDNLVLTLDFAGYQDMDFEITNIVLKDHANDDGTVLPSETPEPELSVSWVDVNSADNLWNGATVTELTSWTSPSDWSGSTPEPEITHEGNKFTLVYSDAPGGDQWQAQFGIVTNLSFSAEKSYDFRVVINPSCNINAATVKPTDFSDGSFWSEGRHDLEAYEDNVIELVNVTAEMPDFKIVFDFAGVQEGATVVVKDIIIQEHREPAAFSWVDVNSDNNLWNGGTIGEISTWTSPSDWSGSTPEPDVTQDGNKFTIVYSDAPGGDQWQAQFALHTDLSFSGEKVYDFRVTINPSCDIHGVTVKPTVEDDDNTFWSDGRHDVEAYEDNIIELKGVSADIPQLKLVFDFAGVKEGATVIVKDIIIQEHQN